MIKQGFLKNIVKTEKTSIFYLSMQLDYKQ